MIDHTPIEVQVLAFFCRRDVWDQHHELLTEKSFVGPEQRVIWQAIGSFWGVDSRAATSDHLSLDTLRALLPPGEEYGAYLELLRGVEVPDDDIAARLIHFLKTRTVRLIGETALEWTTARPDKQPYHYQRVLEAADALIRLESGGDGESVEGFNLGDLTSFDVFTGPRIPLHFSPHITECMGGGAPFGTFGAVLAPYKVGKTVAAINIGAAAALDGFRVAHFTLEEAAKSVMAKYYCVWSGVPWKELAQRKEEALYAGRKPARNVRVFDLSGPNRSFGQIEAIVRGGDSGGSVGGRSDGLPGQYDLVIIDYLALCNPATENTYASLGEDCRRFRSLGVDMQFVGISTWQASKYAIIEGRTEPHHAADSSEVNRVVDWMVTLSQDRVKKLAKKMETCIALNRLGFDNLAVEWKINRHNLRLTELGYEEAWDVKSPVRTRRGVPAGDIDRRCTTGPGAEDAQAGGDDHGNGSARRSDGAREENTGAGETGADESPGPPVRERRENGGPERGASSGPVGGAEATGEGVQ